MLRHHVASIAREAGAEGVAAAYHDYAADELWSYRGEYYFHAASTIKVALLVALFDAIEQGRFRLGARLHVRNRFLSVVDGTPYRVAASRDASEAVQGAIGQSMRLGELAHHMITTSSNLATNLLLDLVGVEAARATLGRFGIEGVELRRGVEDEVAYERGINNEVTALGLLGLFRRIHERTLLSDDSAVKMLEILQQQQFRRGIPAGLPDEVREQAQVAHKTGEISTVAHDAGIVMLPERAPYAVVILTQWPVEGAPPAADRKATVARLSRAIYDHLTAEGTTDP